MGSGKEGGTHCLPPSVKLYHETRPNRGRVQHIKSRPPDPKDLVPTTTPALRFLGRTGRSSVSPFAPAVSPYPPRPSGSPEEPPPPDTTLARSSIRHCAGWDDLGALRAFVAWVSKSPEPGEVRRLRPRLGRPPPRRSCRGPARRRGRSLPRGPLLRAPRPDRPRSCSHSRTRTAAGAGRHRGGTTSGRDDIGAGEGRGRPRAGTGAVAKLFVLHDQVCHYPQTTLNVFRHFMSYVFIFLWG